MSETEVFFMAGESTIAKLEKYETLCRQKMKQHKNIYQTIIVVVFSFFLYRSTHDRRVGNTDVVSGFPREISAPVTFSLLVRFCFFLGTASSGKNKK